MSKQKWLLHKNENQQSKARKNPRLNRGDDEENVYLEFINDEDGR